MYKKSQRIECAAYLEKSCEGRLRLTRCFYRFPRRLPIVQKQGVCLQNHWLRELQKRHTRAFYIFTYRWKYMSCTKHNFLSLSFFLL